MFIVPDTAALLWPMSMQNAQGGRRHVGAEHRDRQQQNLRIHIVGGEAAERPAAASTEPITAGSRRETVHCPRR